MKNTFSMDIQAPPSAVFHWLDDPKRVMEWAEGVVENEDLVKQPGEVGSTFRQVYEERGRRMEFQGRVTAYEKDRRLGIAMVGDGFDLDVEYELEPTSSGTRLVQNSDVHFKGVWKVMGFLMAPFMKKAGEKKCLEDFDRLKALAEAT